MSLLRQYNAYHPKGFLFLECAITLLITSLFMTIIFYYQILIVTWQKNACARIEATNLALATLEGFKPISHGYTIEQSLSKSTGLAWHLVRVCWYDHSKQLQEVVVSGIPHKART